MSRDYKVYLDDIIIAIDKIERYVDGNPQVLSKNEQIFDAVVRNLEIIGEAVKNLPDLVRSKYPAVEWKDIAGLRDVLAHEYFGVNEEIIIDIVSNELPGLKTEVQRMFSDGESKE